MRLDILLLFNSSLFLCAIAASRNYPSLRVQDERQPEHTPTWEKVTTRPYFHESEFHPRYDRRYAKRPLDYEEQKWALKNLTRNYLTTLHALGVETWLTHKTLLGWWWQQQVLPWEPNISVQISEPGIFFLATYHNMSVHRFRVPGTRERRTYLLDISPDYRDREVGDSSNTVDARWVDMQSGLSIDIQVVRYNLAHPGGKGMLSCKDGSEVKDTFLFPLRDTNFEGAPAKIPYRFRELLAAEYGVDALISADHGSHWFDIERSEWVRKDTPDI